MRVQPVARACGRAGLVAVLVAQFLSALADNALLFWRARAAAQSSTIRPGPQPLLQEFFVGAFILLAPFAGPSPTPGRKAAVMLIANGVKFAGSLGMCLGLNPFLAYGLVGVGAATYSPAKYGILSELTSAEHLVKANGLMESSTIAAILIGAIAGGALADWNVLGALLIVTACYAAAAAANLFIPKLPPAHALARHSSARCSRFPQVVARLFSIRDARFSLVGTSLFWGAGSTMRFLLIAWVPVALGITNNSMPAYLNGVVAIGIVVGAGSCREVRDARECRPGALGGGIVLGLAICAISVIHQFLARLRGARGGRRGRRILRRASECALTGEGTRERRCRTCGRGPEPGREHRHAGHDRRFISCSKKAVPPRAGSRWDSGDCYPSRFWGF